MHATLENPCSSSLFSTKEQELVREQLERMLETSHFNQSRRYPALLRFIVEETLEGRGSQLKERLLGIEVFNREPNYDTATDPIVRVTTAEIRKRIAQYYHDEAHDAEMRIELPPGHYLAEFRAGKSATPPRSFVVPGLHDTNSVEAETVPHPSPARAVVLDDFVASTRPVAEPSAGRKIALWLGVAASLMIAAAMIVRWAYPPALEQLWGPVLSSGKQVFICVPTDVGKHRGALTTSSDLSTDDRSGPGTGATHHEVITFLDHETMGENVVFSDAMATLKIANLLALHLRDIRVKLNVTTTLDDLRQGPAVLIGGLDNQWTLQAIAPLRFHFAGSDEEGYWISDAQNQGDRRWSLDLKQQYAKVTRDYALIARVHNGQTGHPQMVVAGIGMSGTVAAGEFLVDAQQVEELRRRIGPGFRKGDFEAVLSTDVVNGIAGTPRIVAVSVP